MWKRDRISLKNRWSSYIMGLYWQCTVNVDVSLICASCWEWFINMFMSGNVILSLYIPRLTSDKLEEADVVMLIVWICFADRGLSSNNLWNIYGWGFNCSRSFYDGSDWCVCRADIATELIHWRCGWCFADLAIMLFNVKKWVHGMWQCHWSHKMNNNTILIYSNNKRTSKT